MGILIESVGEKDIIGLAIRGENMNGMPYYHITWSDGATCGWPKDMFDLYAKVLPNQKVARLLYNIQVKGVKPCLKRS